MVARRYEFYVRVSRRYLTSERMSEILFLPLEHKIHIFELTCNFLFILYTGLFYSPFFFLTPSTNFIANFCSSAAGISLIFAFLLHKEVLE